MAGIRLTGLASGMDTESLVSQLSEAYQMKVDNVKKEQTKLEWKKEAWKGLNTKIMDFYKGSLSTFKSVSTYRAKTATGDLSGVNVKAGNSAVNGTHRVQVKSTATAQMWTGGKITNDEGKSASGSTKLVDLGISSGSTIKINGNAIDIDENTTLSSLASQMNKLGIEANYDAGQGRFYLNAKGTGTENAFTLEGSDAEALQKLGLNLEVDANGDGKLDEVAGRIDAKDAIIEYNGVEYKQSTSTFNINGLTIEAVEEGNMQTFTVGTDAQGIYDKVKKFVNDYNTLIEEMNTLYNAERVKDYEPLTDDEKAAMSEDEIEKWEGVIKGSLLRRDDTISSLLSNMRSILNKSVSVTMSDGTTKNFALSSFGINTGVYSEKGKLHIDGNKDDADYADVNDSLLKAINENPEAVEDTLSAIGSEMYNHLMKAMGKSDISSALTFYNDVQIDNEIDDYKDRVSTLQDKAIAEEDKYYEQFAAMEAAMAKLQAQQSYVAQLFGG